MLWQPVCNINNIYITSDQDMILSYCKAEVVLCLSMMIAMEAQHWMLVIFHPVLDHVILKTFSAYMEASRTMSLDRWC